MTTKNNYYGYQDEKKSVTDILFNNRNESFNLIVFAVVGILVMTGATYAGCFILTNWLVAIIAAAVLMLLAVPLHNMSKLSCLFYIISYFLNSVASGLAVRALYLYYGESAEPLNLALGAIPSVLAVFISFLLLNITKSKKISYSVTLILLLALTVFSAVMWVINSAVYYTFGFFTQLYLLMFTGIYALTKEDYRHELRRVSLGGFGAFFIVLAVVIIIISEGDVFDGIFDGITVDKPIGSKKKNQK